MANKMEKLGRVARRAKLRLQYKESELKTPPINKGIPIPSRQGAPRQGYAAFFDCMEIGDSILLEGNYRETKTQANRFRRAASRHQKNNPWRHSIRLVDKNQTRLWRIE